MAVNSPPSPNSKMAQLITSEADISAAHTVLLAVLVWHTTTFPAAAQQLYGVCREQGAEAESYAESIASFLWVLAVDHADWCPRIGGLIAELSAFGSKACSSNIAADAPPDPQLQACASGFWKQFHEQVGEYYMVKYHENRNRREQDLSSQEEWKGLNALKASYVAYAEENLKEVKDQGYYDLDDSLTVLSRLEEPFEDELDESKNVDADVPAAAAWFLYAAGVVYEACEQRHIDAGNDVRGPLWKGPRDYSIERWAYWKSRFSKVEDLSFALAQTKSAAGSVLSVMGEIEGK